MSKRKNSRAKGCRGERDAAAFLCELGFKAERSARNGVKGCHDLIVHDLPNVSIECKRVEGLDIGTKAMEDIATRASVDALQSQAFSYPDLGISGIDFDSARPTKPWAILWRPNGKKWRLTFYSRHHSVLCTTTGPASICSTLQQLNQGE